MGGPGAVLWMWLVAILGTATAFSEATLAQLFKVRRSDGTFRGGPAYYISRGLRLPILGGLFAVVFLIANGLVMPWCRPMPSPPPSKAPEGSRRTWVPFSSWP